MFSFKGRLNRKSFLIQSVIAGLTQYLNVTIISFVQRSFASGADAGNSLFSIPILLVSLSVSIGLVVFGISILVRRWHDLGKSGWLSIIGIIPVVNLIVWFYLIFKKGMSGSNTYGSAQ